MGHPTYVPYSSSGSRIKRNKPKTMPSEPFVPAEWEIPRVLRYRLGYGLLIIRKSSCISIWPEGTPGDCEIGHATNTDPNRLRAGWPVCGAIIVSTKLG